MKARIVGYECTRYGTDRVRLELELHATWEQLEELLRKLRRSREVFVAPVDEPSPRTMNLIDFEQVQRDWEGTPFDLAVRGRGALRTDRLRTVVSEHSDSVAALIQLSLRH